MVINTKNLIMCAIMSVLAGCASYIPVKQSFPEAPPVLMETPTSMVSTKQNASADEVFADVVKNYGIATEYKIKLVEWQQWYTSQKQLFNKGN